MLRVSGYNVRTETPAFNGSEMRVNNTRIISYPDDTILVETRDDPEGQWSIVTNPDSIQNHLQNSCYGRSR